MSVVMNVVVMNIVVMNVVVMKVIQSLEGLHHCPDAKALGGRPRPCWRHCNGNPGGKDPGDAGHHHHPCAQAHPW